MNGGERLYTKTHEWVRIDGELIVVGITHHAQKELGDLTQVDLPDVGKSVRLGQQCGAVESLKTASELHAPVTGVVAEVNRALDGQPTLVNEDPYGKGWIYKLRNAKEPPAGKLLTAKEYELALREM